MGPSGYNGRNVTAVVVASSWDTPSTANAVTSTYGSSSSAYTLALLGTGEISAMGDCSSGQCAISNVNPPSGSTASGGGTSGAPNAFKAKSSPDARVAAASQQVVGMAAAKQHACYMLGPSGGLRCTGRTSTTALGLDTSFLANTNLYTPPAFDLDFSTVPLVAPYDVSWGRRTVMAVAAGPTFTCALLNTGNVTCWGTNNAGQLGQPTSTASVRGPTTVVPLPGGIPAVGICAGDEFACALQANGSAACWGRNTESQLGILPASAAVSVPGVVLAPGAGLTVSQVACGYRHMCLLLSDGSARCTGLNDWFQADLTPRSTGGAGATVPRFGITNFTASNPIVAPYKRLTVLGASPSASTTCAATDSDVRCWGANVATGSGAYGSKWAPQTNITVTATLPNSATPTAQYLPWPVVQGVAAGTVDDLPGGDGSYVALQLTVWVPMDRSNSAPLVGYLNNVPCTTTTKLNDTTYACTLSPATQRAVAATNLPPLVTISWTGAPAGPLYGLYSCPAPLPLTSWMVTAPSTAAPGRVALTAACLTGATSPWVTTGPVTLGVRQGGVALTIVSSNATTLVVDLVGGVGTQDVVITSTATAVPSSPTGAYTVTFPAPTLQSVAGVGSELAAAGGAIIPLRGANFAPPSLNPLPSLAISVGGVPCTAASFINSSALSCTVPAGAGTATVVAVVGGVSLTAPSPVVYRPPRLTSISPASSWLAAGVNATFIVTGSALGTSLATLTALVIGGVPCPRTNLTWQSTTQVTCAALSTAAMTDGTVMVAIVGQANVTATLLTVIGAPAITWMTPLQGSMNTWSFIEGNDLGVNATANGTNSVAAVGLIESGSSRRLPCLAFSVTPANLGTVVGCLLPNGSTNATYTPYVTILRGPDVVASGVTFSFQTVVGLRPTWYQTADLGAWALPSAADTLFLLAPSPQLLIATDTGGTPATAVVCMASLDATKLPVSTIQSALAGNTTVSGVMRTGVGVVAKFDAAVVGASNFNYTLTAQCSYGGSGTWYGVTGVKPRVRVAALVAGWSVSPPNTTVPSVEAGRGDAGMLSPMSPAPQLILYAVSATGVWTRFTFPTATPRVSCAVSAVSLTPGVTVDVTGTLAVTPTAAGVATWSNLGVLAPPGARFRLSAVCSWMTGEAFTSAASYPGATVDMRWALTASPATFIYNTLTAPAAATLQYTTDGGATMLPLAGLATFRAVDTSCLLTATATATGGTMIMLGGGVSGLDTSSLSLAVAGVALQPAVATLPQPITATLTLSCTFRQQPLPAIAWTAAMQNLTLSLASATPLAVTSSSAASAVPQPSFSVAVDDAAGSRLTSDTSTCTLTVASGVSAAGAPLSRSQAYTDRGAVAVAVGGIATFSGWTVVAPLNALLTFGVSCTRAEGGPPASLTWPAAVRGAQVDWLNATTLDANFSLPLFLYDTPYTVALIASLHDPLQATNSTPYVPLAYSSDDAPGIVCSLAVDASAPAAAKAVLSGNPRAYQGATGDADGVVTFVMRLTAAVDTPIPLVATCNFGDATVRSSLQYVQVAAVVAEWVSTPTSPPPTFIFNTPTTTVTAVLFAVTPANVSAGTVAGRVPVYTSALTQSDVSCAVSARMSDTGALIMFAGGDVAGVDVATGNVAVAPMSLSPALTGAQPINVSVALSCSFRQMPVPALLYATVLQNLTLAWVTPPPATAMSSTLSRAFLLPDAVLALRDADGHLLSTDSSTTCSLAVSAGRGADGKPLSKQQAAADGGVAATAVAGLVTFTAWSLTAPPAATLTLAATCTRAEGGLPLTATAPIALQSSDVVWASITSVDTRPGLPFATALWSTPFNATARVRLRIPTTATNGSVYTVAPYTAAGAPATTCSVSLDASSPALPPGAQLLGTASAYTSVPAAADGTVPFVLRVTAPVRAAVPLRVTCRFGDVTIATTASWQVVVAGLTSSWCTATMPTLFMFGASVPPITAAFSMVLPGNASVAGATTDVIRPVPSAALVSLTAADLACSLSITSVATGSARVVPYTGGALTPVVGAPAATAGNLTLTIGSLAMTPTFAGVRGAVDATLQLACTYRAFAPPTLTATAYMQNLSVLWVEPPPAVVSTSTGAQAFTLPPLRVVLQDQFRANLTADSGSVCTVSVGAGVGADGKALTKQQAYTAGNVSGVTVGGVAAITGWRLYAPLAASLTLQVDCARAGGGPVVTTTAPTAVLSAEARLGPAATLDPARTRTVAFYGTPSNVTVQVLLHIPTTSRVATVYTLAQYTTTLAPSTTCSLAVDVLAVGRAGYTAALGCNLLAYTNAPVNGSGWVTFSVCLAAPARRAVPLLVTCTYGDTVLPRLALNMTVTGLAASVAARPPPLVLPSPASRFTPMPGALVVSLRDDFGTLVPDSVGGATCVATAATTGTQAWAAGVLPVTGSLAAVAARYPVTVRGTSVASTVGGNATFGSLGLDGAAGTQVTVTVTCSRAQGGVSAATNATTLLAAVSVDWVTLPPARVLYNTPYAASAAVSVQASVGAGWEWAPYNPATLGDVACALRVTDADGAAGVALGGGALSQSVKVSATGTATYTLVLQAPGGSTAHLSVACEVLGTPGLATTFSNSTVEVLSARFAAPPPARWLPTSPSFILPITPAPLVQITNAAGDVVDSPGVACKVTVNASAYNASAWPTTGWLPRLLDMPDDGYRYSSTAGGVSLAHVVPSSWWGTTLPLLVVCTRPQGDTIAPLPWAVTMVAANVSWVSLPNTRIATNDPLPLYLQLVDEDTGARRTTDNMTACVVVVTGTPVPIVRGDATAVMGAVTFDALQLLGKPSTHYDIAVSCKFGDMPYPATVPVGVDLQGCSVGWQPVSNGAACQKCADNSYSDGGGQGCTSCPVGVQCVDGVLSTLPGYYLALTDDMMARPAAYNLTMLPGGRVAAAYVAATTELHTCWNTEACVVNASERSYGCAEGYSGTLCGVCRMDERWVKSGAKCTPCADPTVDFVALTLIIMFILLILMYLSLFMDFGNASAAKTVWRIMVNFISALAAFSLYKAKGTESFNSSVSSFQSIIVPGAGTGLDVSPVQCELQLGFYTRFTATILFPVIAAALCVCINVVYIVGYTSTRGVRVMVAELRAFWATRRQIAVAALVLFMAYPSLTSQAFTMFACKQEAIAGVHYLEVDLAVSCDTPVHALAATLAWVTIGLLCAGLPAIFAYWLRKHDVLVKEGPGNSFFATFGFLYQGYKTDVWYYYSWEALVMARKALVVAIGTTTKDAVYQICALELLMLAALGLQLHVAPYARPLFNFLESATLLALILTQAINLLYLRASTARGGVLASFTPQTSRNSQEETLAAAHGMLGETAASVMLLFMNFGIVFMLVFFYVRIRRREMSGRAGCCGFLSEWLGFRKELPHHLILEHMERNIRAPKPLSTRTRSGKLGKLRVTSNPLSTPKPDPVSAAASAAAAAAAAGHKVAPKPSTPKPTRWEFLPSSVTRLDVNATPEERLASATSRARAAGVLLHSGAGGGATSPGFGAGGGFGAGTGLGADGKAAPAAIRTPSVGPPTTPRAVKPSGSKPAKSPALLATEVGVELTPLVSSSAPAAPAPAPVATTATMAAAAAELPPPAPAPAAASAPAPASAPLPLPPTGTAAAPATPVRRTTMLPPPVVPPAPGDLPPPPAAAAAGGASTPVRRLTMLPPPPMPAAPAMTLPPPPASAAPAGAGAGASASAGPVWTERLDAATGAVYFTNAATGATQWERPEGATVIPRGSWPWEQRVDATYNHPYYYNNVTGATQWTAPDGWPA